MSGRNMLAAANISADQANMSPPCAAAETIIDLLTKPLKKGIPAIDATPTGAECRGQRHRPVETAEPKP